MVANAFNLNNKETEARGVSVMSLGYMVLGEPGIQSKSLFKINTRSKIQLDLYRIQM